MVEEYFHGYDRDLPHDLRSASKSWVAVLLGAAMQAGVPIRPNTPVYQTMLDSVPADLDPRKRAMTQEHLISMTAGYDCASDSAKGNEDVMQSQTAEPDWYRYSLDVPMLTAPGDTIVYCSIEPNLAGGMLRKISGEPLPEMFYRLVAKPLQMDNYHLFLSPTGEAYGGGGHQFVPRDFLKLAQLMVNQGRWAGRQIISRDWALKSGSALRNLSKIQQYGWLWNSVEYPYQGRAVRAYFAAGNGGQIFMGIPALDLVIGFTGGTTTTHRSLFPSGGLCPISSSRQSTDLRRCGGTADGRTGVISSVARNRVGLRRQEGLHGPTFAGRIPRYARDDSLARSACPPVRLSARPPARRPSARIFRK